MKFNDFTSLHLAVSSMQYISDNTIFPSAIALYPHTDNGTIRMGTVKQKE